jgi:predicted secreted protein
MAEHAILGYSDDGRYFAFEQFGIQDGSGFAYSEIFIIDLIHDRWVSGGPIRVTLEEEGAGLRRVRQEARERAHSRLARYNIGAPFRLLAATTPMEASAQEEVMAFYPRPILRPIDPVHKLRLTRVPLDSPQDCFWMDDTAGFALTMQVEGAAERQVYRDEVLPRSRFCPTRYGISQIVMPFDGAPGRAVALISVYQLGFEGLDRRFLAVPFDMSF